MVIIRDLMDTVIDALAKAPELGVPLKREWALEWPSFLKRGWHRV